MIVFIHSLWSFPLIPPSTDSLIISLHYLICSLYLSLCISLFLYFPLFSSLLPSLLITHEFQLVGLVHM